MARDTGSRASSTSPTSEQEPAAILDPYEGSNPDAPYAEPEKPRCDHAWDILPTISGRPPRYEHCLLCRAKRPVPPPAVRIFVPPVHCARTGY